MGKEKSEVGEGQGGCFLRLHFLQAPWRREKGRERSQLGPGPHRTSGKRDVGPDPIQPDGLGFEDLQETDASHPHRRRRGWQALGWGVWKERETGERWPYQTSSWMWVHRGQGQRFYFFWCLHRTQPVLVLCAVCEWLQVARKDS